MKVYLQPDTTSRGIMRVVDALIKYAPPSVEIVSAPEEAELEIIHAWGRVESLGKRIAKIRSEGRKYAMIQYAIRSTMRPHTKDWIDLWGKAKVVWSYYNLSHLADEDFVSGDFNFYYAPLGVDEKMFHKLDILGERYKIMATSQHALAESVRECAFATKRVGGRMLFVGHELRRGPDIVCKSHLFDEELAREYSLCDYVSGLRRTEGFELPVIEGAMCGAKPIVFDQPHYRKWFNEFAIFIPETDRAGVIDNLERIFQQARKQITDSQLNIIRDRFNWSRIINGFWKEVI